MAVSQSLGPVISSLVFILFSVWAQFSGYRLMAKELTFLTSFFSSGQDDRMVTASRLDSPVLASKGKEKKGNLAVGPTNPQSGGHRDRMLGRNSQRIVRVPVHWPHNYFLFTLFSVTGSIS